MGRKGTCRKDTPATCEVCGQQVKPSNLERHLVARHPDAGQLRDLRSASIREMLERRE
jgi:hypothetical protein